MNIQIVEKLWSDLVGTEFSALQLANILRFDGGIDFSDLPIEDVVALIENRYTGDWREPAFSFSELLAYYSVIDQKLEPTHFVGWVCATLIMSDCVKKDAADWDMEFDKIMDTFTMQRSQIASDTWVDIFHELF